MTDVSYILVISINVRSADSLIVLVVSYISSLGLQE